MSISAWRLARRVVAGLGCGACLLGLAAPAFAADGPGAAAFAAMQKAAAAGDTDGAVKFADQVVEAEPRNVAYLNVVGGVYCEKAGKANVFTKFSWAAKCRETWERAVGIDPKNIDVRMSLIQYYVRAPGIAGGGVDKAQAQATAIVGLDPVLGEIAWGNIAMSQKQPADAEPHFKKAAELDKAAMRGPVALASFYAGQGRWPDARGVFERRLANGAIDPFASYQIARLMQAQSVDLDKAIALFDGYLAAPPPPGGPTHADAWFRKGQVYLQLKRTADARTAFQTALKLVPGHQGATRELSRLKG